MGIQVYNSFYDREFSVWLFYRWLNLMDEFGIKVVYVWKKFVNEWKIDKLRDIVIVFIDDGVDNMYICL